MFHEIQPYNRKENHYCQRFTGGRNILSASLVYTETKGAIQSAEEGSGFRAIWFEASPDRSFLIKI